MWLSWRGTRHVSLVVVLCLAAGLLFTYPLVRSMGSALPGNLGDPLLNAWTLGWGAQWMGGGAIGGDGGGSGERGDGRNVWNAPIFHPHDDTFAYSEHLLGVSLFVAPVYWATQNAILTYNVALIGSFVLAGVGIYLLIAALTGRKDVAILLALAFACSPIRLGAQIARLQMLMTGWLPLALWAIHRYGATMQRRYLVAFAISTLLLVLSNMYMLLIAALPIGLVLLFELGRARGRRLRFAGEMAVTLGTIALLLAPVVAKYRGVQQEMGFSRDAGEIVRYSATLRSYFSAFETMEWLPYVYREETADRALYPGAALLLLGGLGVVIAAGFTARGLWRGRGWPGRREASDGNRAADVHGAGAGLGLGVFALYFGLTVAAVGLSFGPQLRGWDGQVLGDGPYAWLQRVLPMIEGLRAPGRYGVVACLGLSVMAGFGLTWLFGRPASRVRLLRPAIVAAMLALVVVEAWPVQFKVEPFGPRARPEDHALYHWLRQAPPSTLVELPSAPLASKFSNAMLIYQYETLEHPHALVNGSSGFNSPLADLLEGAASPLGHPSLIADGVGMLRTLGVRYVAIHTADYADPDLAARIVEAFRQAPGVLAHHTFGLNALFELQTGDRLPAPAPPRFPRIPIGPSQLVASHGHDQTHHVLDAQLESRWTVGEPKHRSWMRVRLARSHDVREIRLELGTSRDVYPRTLVIVGTDEHGRDQQLYNGDVLSQLAVGLIHEPQEAPIVIPFPPNRTQTLTLHAADEEAPTTWSVHELALYGAPVDDDVGGDQP